MCDLKDVIPMLRSLGISPEQLGPEKMERIQNLAEKIGDPSQMSVADTATIMRELGVGLGDKKKKVIKDGPKAKRNDKCKCDSGKKYKHCCGLIL